MTEDERDDGGAWGDEVYQPGDPDGREDEGILDEEDTLSGRGVDPYDEGYSPPERPLGVNRVGVTGSEQYTGESLDQRLSEENPDPALQPPDGDDIGDWRDGAGEPLDDEVGGARSGRLVAPDEGAHEDEEKDLLASDIGIDGGAASAEEAAMHVVADDDGLYE
ncbi:hypothetical protein SRB5_09000 [Streptomyces sp. RB5]|uniref:DUF5709 domain-containing protein n=1 Tax=Streptomyces smaragdinus TaxID=2585196 RepID=A0A7K0CBF2_9ACTN|nr:DUF5709 domain-containing protein [Streptomyces smaragdinus]MQY10787.1 hypothetical protein [Streptomyces smaragdinus]